MPDLDLAALRRFVEERRWFDHTTVELLLDRLESAERFPDPMPKCDICRDLDRLPATEPRELLCGCGDHVSMWTDEQYGSVVAERDSLASEVERLRAVIAVAAHRIGSGTYVSHVVADDLRAALGGGS